MRRISRLTAFAAAGLIGFALIPPAGASILQPTVVSENAQRNTPELVPTTGIDKPRTDAITQLGGTLYIGGFFGRVVDNNGTTFNRTNIAAFDASSGDVASFAPNLNGRVFALASAAGSVYIGGKFRAVNGVTRPSVVKVDAVTGAVDTGFNTHLRGRVNSLIIENGQLYVGGAFTKNVTAVNLQTGADTGSFDLDVTDPIPNAWGNVSVYAMAINPAGTRLIATGNFMTVAGQNRVRMFVADISGPTATLDPWYYASFRKACSSTNPRRIAYLQGVDFSPDGSYFIVTATGQISQRGDLNETVCDSAGRFNMNDDTKPVWINYTGGDSVWTTAATGAAVYVQGHFQWLDNPHGFASRDGGGAARRVGIGAIDPDTGLALSWAPDKKAQIGGKAFLATSAGLWVGSDSLGFNGASHRGIAFCPLP